MSLRVLAVVAGFLSLCLLLGQPTDAQETGAALKAKVHKLVEQLADANENKQEAAALELVKLGPAVLPHLPGPGTKLKPAQARHLAAITKLLRDAEAKKNVTPKLVTLKSDSITLDKASSAWSRARETAAPSASLNTATRTA